jgi:hypothetical protein
VQVIFHYGKSFVTAIWARHFSLRQNLPHSSLGKTFFITAKPAAWARHFSACARQKLVRSSMASSNLSTTNISQGKNLPSTKKKLPKGNLASNNLTAATAPSGQNIFQNNLSFLTGAWAIHFHHNKVNSQQHTKQQHKASFWKKKPWERNFLSSLCKTKKFSVILD